MYVYAYINFNSFITYRSKYRNMSFILNLISRSYNVLQNALLKLLKHVLLYILKRLQLSFRHMSK